LSRAKPSIHSDAFELGAWEFSNHCALDFATKEEPIDHRDQENSVHDDDASNLKNWRWNQSEEKYDEDNRQEVLAD
jgi:hypothetical protein